MQESNSLVEVDKINALTVFTKEGVEPLLKSITEKVRTFKPNTKTAIGRHNIASLANKVARSKTLIDSLGKELVSEWKLKSKVVDDSRKVLRDSLDKLKIEAREPLTNWEIGETERVHCHKSIISRLIDLGSVTVSFTSIILKDRLKKVKELLVGEDLQEFSGEALVAQKLSIFNLEEALKKRETHEKEREELRVFRAEKLKKEAIEKEKQADTKQKEDAENLKLENQKRLKRDKQKAIEAKEKAQREAVEAKEKLANEKKNKKAAIEKARQEERLKFEQQAQKEVEAKEKREANAKHCSKINLAATKAIAGCIATDKNDSILEAEQILNAIIAGKIPNVTIQY